MFSAVENAITIIFSHPSMVLIQYKRGKNLAFFSCFSATFRPTFRPTFCPFLSFCCHLPPFCHHPAVPLSRRIPSDWWQSGSKNFKNLFFIITQRAVPLPLYFCAAFPALIKPLQWRLSCSASRSHCWQVVLVYRLRVAVMKQKRTHGNKEDVESYGQE